MARAGILYSQVVIAAVKLAAAGKTPTVDSVRLALGDTGSKSTIGPMLKRWKDEQDTVVSEAASGLPAPLVQAVRKLHESMQSETTAKLADAAEKHRELSEASKAEIASLRAAQTALEKEKARIINDLDKANLEISKLDEKVRTQATTISVADGENAGLKQRLADRAAEVASINQQLRQTRVQFEHYQESSSAQRAEERESLERRITQQDQELARLRQHLELKQIAIAKHDGVFVRVTEENERLRENEATNRKQLAQLTIELDRAETRTSELDDVHAKLQGEHANLELEIAQARTNLAVQSRELQLLARRQDSNDSRIQALVDDKLALSLSNARLEEELSQYRFNNRHAKD